MPGIVVRALMADERLILDQVVALGDRNKKWLGLLPHAAFAEYAAEDKILVALNGDELLGYAVFDRPHQHIRLVQLCVMDAARRQGIARKLVDDLSRRHPDRRGIVARCRRDWPAADCWPALGFRVMSNAPGRSKQRHLLTYWWRDHHVPDLFSTLVTDSPRLTVAIDTNVFRDLHELGRGPDASQSAVLNTDWVAEEVEIVLPAGVLTELNRHPDPRLRESLLRTANSGSYRIVGEGLAPGSAAAMLRDELLGAIPPEDISHDPSLPDDAGLLAEAAAADADAFVSRDATAVRVLTAAAERLTDIWVSTPTALLVHLDELRDAAHYAPARLLNTGFSVAGAGAKREADLRPLLNHAAGESWHDLLVCVRASAADVGRNSWRLVLEDPSGLVVAGAFCRWDDDVLTVALLRVAASSLAKTIATQLLHLLRTRAGEQGLRRIEIVDRYVSDPLAAALLEVGYSRNANGFRAHLMDGCLTWHEVLVQLRARGVGRDSSDEPTSLEAAELERVFWPLKVVDAPLPNFLVPIKPALAEALFNRQAALWSEPELGLSRQHVYYRTPALAGLRAPGRILWYVSGTEREAVAVSRLERIVVEHPGTLHRRYRRLGVLDRGVIADQARAGKAMALLFADTEFFNAPIPLERLREIDCRLNPLPSPRAIDSSSFFAVYKEGNPA